MPEDKLLNETHELLINIFADLRSFIPGLGIGDLLDVLRLADGDWEFDSLSEKPESTSLQQDVGSLWCRSWPEQQEFNRLWQAHRSKLQAKISETKTGAPAVEARKEPVEKQTDGPIETEAYTPPTARTQTPLSPPSASAVPIKTPAQLSSQAAALELRSYWPITRRSIEYGWQYLRRLRDDGPAGVLDIAATIEDAARQGLLLRPVYRQETRNHSHLVLLIDSRGSMTPFHPLARDFVETAQRAQSEGAIGRLDVFYFDNVANDNLYLNPKLSEMVKRNDKHVSLEEALAHCDRETGVLIISDAGAARGNRSLGRLEATEEMIYRLSRKTRSIAWLNPMPQTRWRATSATTISTLVPMFEMSKLGFNGAIKAIRGQLGHMTEPQPK
jgi:hypothetical protein